MKNKIHIWNLPTKQIYIKLKSPFRENFFDKAYKKFGSWEKLGNCLQVKRGDTLLARNWKNGLSCCPLSTIIKISTIIGSRKEEIEMNILELRNKTSINKRGGNSGKPIINPKLPIIIDKNFADILGHICGDGSIVRKNPEKGISLKYSNSEPKLIQEFQKSIKEVFGDVDVNIQVRDGPTYRRKNYLLQYPTIISLYILSVFDCKSGDNKSIPNIIFELSQEEKCSFLKALFDDEGSVNIKDKSISIGLKPLNQIEALKKLLITLDFLPTNIFWTGGINRIKVGKQKDILLFKDLIGFDHPGKKEKLDLIIKNGWKFLRNSNRPEMISCLKKGENNE